MVGGIGVPPVEANLPPIIERNYGKWISHDIVKPGVLRHTSETGEECYTVRIGMPPARISTTTMLKICDLADEYSEGSFRITLRNSLEFVGVKEERIDELIKKLQEMGFPVGGADHSIHNIIACPAWLHCQLSATDAPGIAKAIGDVLYEDFKREDYPAKLKINLSSCSNIEEGLTGDIGILGVHRDLPQVLDDEMKKCEIPLVIAVCPTGAIKPKGRESIEINPERCIHCGACTMRCPYVLTGKPETDGVAIAVGGKGGNTGAGPGLARVVVPYLPNNPPRWPEVTQAVEKIVKTWVKDAKKHERIRDWIARIGWEKFFERTGLPVTYKLFDGYVFGMDNVKANLQFRW